MEKKVSSVNVPWHEKKYSAFIMLGFVLGTFTCFLFYVTVKKDEGFRSEYSSGPNPGLTTSWLCDLEQYFTFWTYISFHKRGIIITFAGLF